MIRVAIFVAAVFCGAPAADAEERFPLGFWYGPPARENKAETWRTVREAGFTLVGPCYGYTRNDNLALLAHCEREGLQAIVVDERIRPEMVAEEDWRGAVRQVAADYGQSAALSGYFLHDEPSARWFPILGEISGEFQRSDPRHKPYVNLYPTYAPPQVRGAATYRAYLQQCVDTVHPAVLSFDHYPLLKSGADRPDYFENLEAVRSVANAARLPTWSIVQVAPHEPYRDPTADELRWQAFTSLAYGAKGLLYFTYSPPPALATEAIVDAAGKPTRRYAAVQELNRQIQAIGPRLLTLRSTAVYHTGPIPVGCTRLPMEAIVQVPAELPLIVGCFENAQHEPLVMLVNRDYQRSCEFDVVVRHDVVAVTRFDAEDGQAAEVTLEKRRFPMNLPPGGGRLIALRGESKLRPPFQAAAEIRFEFNADDEDWQAAQSLEASNADQGVLRSRITGVDPHFSRTFLAVPANRYRRVVVRMKTPGAKAQFYWQTARERTFDDARHVDFATLGDGEFHEYVIELGQHAGWKGQAIRAIRLDPADGAAESERGQTVEIDHLRGE